MGEASRRDDSDADDFDEFLEGLDDSKEWSIEEAADYHAAALRKDVEKDLVLLRQLKAQADKVNEGIDAKAEALIERLRAIAAEARRPVASGVSSGDRRKTVVFSAFTDTVEDIRESMIAAIETAADDDPLSDYRDRVGPAVIGSRSASGQEQKATILAGFAPKTAGRDGSTDRYDLLLTTDVLSEGEPPAGGAHHQLRPAVEPHASRPRHGRGPHRLRAQPGYLDRLRPLDAFVDLEARLHRKLAQADAALGVGKVIPGFVGSQGRVFAEKEDQIRKFAEEDPELSFAERNCPLRRGVPQAPVQGHRARQRVRRSDEEVAVRVGFGVCPLQRSGERVRVLRSC